MDTRGRLMGYDASQVYNRALLDSLKTIKRLHDKLKVVMVGVNASPTALK